jgi:excisionase family DNA binding protein
MQEKINNPKLGYSVEEASEVSSLSKPFIRLEISRGKLQAKKCGRRVVILHDDLLDYLKQTTAKVAAA